MIVVAHNLAAMNANRQFNITGKKKAKNVEKLSSGYRINRAADDAAGLSISEKMRNQIRGLHQAMSNIEDGVNFCQVADGALNEVHSILGRIGELAVRAANDVNEEDDRKSIDNEVQQLKSEMSKIFRTTEFNGKRYWVQSYIPEVEGTPDDIKIYSTDSDKHNGYGGMLINGIRYSWDDLGVTFDDNGYFTTNDSGGGFNDYKGEHIAWETSPCYVDGNQNVVVEKGLPPDIHRLYEWKADENGISVNNILAISKEDLLDNPLSKTSEGTFYGFDHHGMHIEFLVPNEDMDDWDAICEGINGRSKGGFDSTAAWETVAITPSEVIEDSVTFNGGNTVTKDIYISDEWKDNVADRTNYYSLDTMAEDNDGDGHGDGIRLVDNGRLVSDDEDNNVHTDVKWEQFHDASVTSENSNGGYPIVDWGTDYDNAHLKSGHSESDVTLKGSTDEEPVTYTYTDSLTGYSFDFNLTDEVSLENMERELREATVSTRIIAPTATSIANPTASVINSAGASVSAGRLTAGATEMTYALQRDSGISFGNGMEVSAERFNIHYNVSSFSSDEDILNADRITLQYNLHTTGSDEQMLAMSASITGERLKSMVRNGGDYTFTFSNSRYMDGLVDSDGDGRSDEEGELLDKSVTYKMSFSMKLHVDKVFSRPDYESTINSAYLSSQKENEGASDVDALIDKLCRTEHADWYNGDDVLPEHATDRDNYSTREAADTVKNVSADSSGNYTFMLGGRAVTLSQSERDKLVSWRAEAETEYDNKLAVYNDNLDKQYISIYNLLKNASLSTKQTAHPKQEVTLNEIATEGQHTVFDIRVNTPEKHMYIQTGANAGEHQEIRWQNLSLSAIGMNGARTVTRESSTATITKVQNAIRIVSRERSKFGAQQVRLERAYDNNANYSENLQNAESNIRDTDMAKEAMDLAKHGILEQAGQSMLAQANQQNQGILQLIQG